MLRSLVAAPLLFAALRTSSAQRHVVIDTDVGPDDLMAIAFLLGRRDVHIDGIITETGLANADAGARNVLRLLHLAGANRIPVYVGIAKHLQPTEPFPKAWIDASEQLGASVAPPATRRPERSSAIDYLARVLSAKGTSVELLALGPLTNVALAIRAAGRGRVQPIRTVIMGGAVDVPGNLVTPEMKTDNTKAEWNIFSDPLAAREVFDSPLRVELAALDATRHVPIDSCFVRVIGSGPSTPRRAYVGRILGAERDWIERGDYFAWDPLAAVALVDKRVVQLSNDRLTVDVTPPFLGWTHRAPRGRAVAVASTADRQAFMRVFDAALGARGGRRMPACP
ncbi:MAG: nucleoside hydrolase [Gemmatimonadetes bacterium]|nr:nucleoside hydrolase [Gemmatimonadota bacterium]